ncbi:carbohydrate ABC transporter permease [Streptomyces sp. Mo3]|uniref:carbohydrate ABC transporter permease n=1 Tax=Streptomyces sp. Mo3 TaxID=3161190 RepID=UPI0039EEC44B
MCGDPICTTSQPTGCAGHDTTARCLGPAAPADAASVCAGAAGDTGRDLPRGLLHRATEHGGGTDPVRLPAAHPLGQLCRTAELAPHPDLPRTAAGHRQHPVVRRDDGTGDGRREPARGARHPRPATLGGAVAHGILSPTIATMSAMSVVWRWLFYPDTGLVDATIGRLVGGTDWLHSTTLALPAIAMIGSWAGIGSSMVMFLAGLSSVPRHLHEAGRLDGAGPWHRFWHITWPALGPSTMFALIIATRDALRVFDQVRVMTDGGPLGSTETLAHLQWRYGVSYLDIGSGSIVNTVLLGLVLVTVAAQYLAGGRRLERAGAR